VTITPEPEVSIHARFERQVISNPDRVALQTRTTTITYGELDARANRIANALLERGVCDGARVAVLVEGPEALIPCLLGVLKSGNVYVPLDPTYPPARIAYALEDSGAPLLLADHATRALADAFASASVEILDAGTTLLARDGDARLPLIVNSGDSFAYIIYTSGSTGAPKGVIQTHANLLEFVRNYARPFAITSDDRLTLFYSPSFSASLMDIFGALLHGASLLPYPVKALGIGGLAEWLAVERLTIFHAVPTLFRQFVESLYGQPASPTIRGIDLGGEPVISNDFDLFREHFADGCVLVNHYAATEVSVIAQQVLTKESEVARGILPVGRPANGNSVTIVDDEMREVPVGTAGQIVVHSSHLSVGYWNEPELTATTFRPDPANAARRLYLTGDLGRLGADGVLEHLGRTDARVKIRGHSVEVAETEAALLALGDFRETAVVAREDEYGTPQLVAYVVPKSLSAPKVDEVRTRLRAALPDFMVPAKYVTMERLPVTPNGKLDRRALPEPGCERPDLGGSFTAPRDEIERSLASIWEDVLGVHPIGVDDNFFDLGGDSIRAVRMCAMVRKTLETVVPQSALLRAPTIATFAAIARGESESSTDSALLTVQKGGAEPPVFLVHGLSGGILFSWDIARELGPERPFYAVEGVPRLDYIPGRVRVEDLATEYRDLIRTVRPNGPYTICGFSFGGLVAFEIAKQLIAQGEEVAFLGLIDAHAPGYPNVHPLVRRMGEHFTALYEMPREKWPTYFAKRLRFVRSAIRDRIGRPKDQKATTKRPRTSLMFEAFRIAARTYAPGVYPGETYLFRAKLRIPVRNPDPEHGWGPYVSGPLHVKPIPGHHLSCIREPNVAVLARAFADALLASERKSKTREPGGMHATAHAPLW
jgi:amino acid adenylation domain-containing protein